MLSMTMIFVLACNKVDISSLTIEQAIENHIPSRERDANVTPTDASYLADIFYSSNFGHVSITKSDVEKTNLRSAEVTISEDDNDLMYVFNYEDGGFVIVGSTRDYYPILAYSDKGKLELREDIGPVAIWLNEAKENIIHSNELSDEDKTQMRIMWSYYEDAEFYNRIAKMSTGHILTKSTGEEYCWTRIDYLQDLYGSDGWTFLPLSQVEDLFVDLGLSSYYSNICYSATQNHSALSETIIGYKNPVINQYGPFIQTQWHQHAPFNALCSGHPAGCAVVAAAQVVKYHQIPSTTLSWDGVPFTLSDIDIPLAPSASSKQKYLIRLLAQKFQIDYESGDNGATPYDVCIGLDSLGYFTYYQSHYNNSDVRYELVNDARPVIMYGVDYYLDDAHMWVCDGAEDEFYNEIKFYTENQPYGSGTFTQGMYSLTNPGLIGNTNSNLYLHMNWGWYGDDCDGWFSAFNVSSDGGNYNQERYDIFVTLQ